jgi:hypothetical protein
MLSQIQNHVLRSNFFVFLPFALIIVSPYTAILGYFLLLLLIMLGPRLIIQALVIVWLIGQIQVQLKSQVPLGSIPNTLLIATSALSVLIHYYKSDRQLSVSRFFLFAASFCMFLMLHSCFFSNNVLVSVLKVFLWSCSFLTLLLSWTLLPNHERKKLIKWIFQVLVAIALFSLFLINSNIGYLTNKHGFQGVLNHVQAFGLTMAILSSLVLGKMISNRNKILLLPILLLSLTFLVMSECRTGIFGLFLAFILAIYSFNIFSNSKNNSRKNNILIVKISIIISLIIFSLFFDLTDNIFFSKYSVPLDQLESINFAEAYLNSRGHIAEAMIENIKNNLFSGIGFGIASDIENMIIQRDPFFGLPISAPIEKSILPLAIIEEIGIAAFILFVILIYSILRRSAANGFDCYLVALVILIMNFAELTFFSPSGWGMISLVLITWASSYSNKESNSIHAF